MSISVSPRPSDGPLSAKGPQINLSVSTTSGAFFSAVVRTPLGAMVPIENMVLPSGTHHLVLSLPPGGVPSGSTLIVRMREPSGGKAVVRYSLA